MYGINDRGVMVGGYAAGGMAHGFVRDREGKFTTIDYPGAPETALLEIHDRGQIVGSYGDDVGGGLSRDFVLDHGDYTPIEFPGAPESYVDDVNNRGQIVGYYLDEAGAYHGYLRGRRGRYSPIDHPAAVAPGNDTAGLQRPRPDRRSVLRRCGRRHSEISALPRWPWGGQEVTECAFPPWAAGRLIAPQRPRRDGRPSAPPSREQQQTRECSP